MAARGMNIFHASQVVAGASCKLDDQASDSASEDPNRPWTTVPTLTAVSTPHSDLTLNVDVARHWSESPPPPTQPSHPAPLSQHNHKRNFSAIASTEASSISNTPSASASHKKARVRIMSNAEALAGLRSQLAMFGKTFLEGTSSLAAPTSVIAPSPTHKTMAIQRAQELELDLDDEKLVSLICIFQADMNDADAYLILKREGVWKRWIKSTLSTLL